MPLIIIIYPCPYVVANIFQHVCFSWASFAVCKNISELCSAMMKLKFSSHHFPHVWIQLCVIHTGVDTHVIIQTHAVVSSVMKSPFVFMSVQGPPGPPGPIGPQGIKVNPVSFFPFKIMNVSYVWISHSGTELISFATKTTASKINLNCCI